MPAFENVNIYIGFSTKKSKVLGHSALNGCIFFFAFLDGCISFFLDLFGRNFHLGGNKEKLL